MTTSRQLALELFLEWTMQRNVFMDRLLAESLPGCGLEARDRAFATQLCYGAMRHRNTLLVLFEHYYQGQGEHTDRVVRETTMLGLYQLLFLRTSAHALVDGSVTAFDVRATRDEKSFGLRKRGKAIVNGILRRACRETVFVEDQEKNRDDRNMIFVGDPARAATEDRAPQPWACIPELNLPQMKNNAARHLGVKYSHPTELVRIWLERFAEEDLVQMLKWDNEVPSTNIVVRCSTTPQKLLRKLTIAKAVAVDLQRSAMLQLESSRDLERLPGYEAGEWWVQDITAREIALMLPVRNDSPTLLDLCSSPGGKLATLMDRANFGRVVAADVSQDKLQRVRENIERLGLGAVDYLELPELPNKIRLDTKFDQIIVDVPCSNTGVLNRRHEARWRFVPENVKELNRIQQGLLKAAAGHLARGGDLLYSTCSLEPSENSAIVYGMLRSEPELRLVEEREILPGTTETPNTVGIGGRRVGDGGYAALIKRR